MPGAKATNPFGEVCIELQEVAMQHPRAALRRIAQRRQSGNSQTRCHVIRPPKGRPLGTDYRLQSPLDLWLRSQQKISMIEQRVANPQVVRAPAKTIELLCKIYATFSPDLGGIVIS